MGHAHGSLSRHPYYGCPKLCLKVENHSQIDPIDFSEVFPRKIRDPRVGGPPESLVMVSLMVDYLFTRVLLVAGVVGDVFMVTKTGSNQDILLVRRTSATVRPSRPSSSKVKRIPTTSTIVYVCVRVLDCTFVRAI